ncbi:MAG: cytochrome c oxidase subunit 3 [Leptospiraceae bacterium]|nr:cytochrome c oxidase subunit 3 [Leptospiraceae bacterium]
MSHSAAITNPTLRDMPKGRLGTWALIAGEIAIFSGFIMAYVLYRLRYPEWADQAKHTSTMYGAINTFVLLSSSYSVVLAHGAAVKKDLKKVVIFLGITLLCGFIFLGVKSIEYTNEIHHGFTLTSPSLITSKQEVGTLFWSFYYAMTGLHATHVIAGMIAIFIVMMQARKGVGLHRVELAGLYWHMVDIVWIFLFPLLYIAK